MSDQLIKHIERLPQFIGKYIFTYLIPEPEAIEFGDYRQTQRDWEGYSFRYEVAFLNNVLLENTRGIYLSRIRKNNGKHRYYLTGETGTRYCNGCGIEGCCSEYCRGGWEYETYYESQYIGKDLKTALCTLMSNCSEIVAKKNMQVRLPPPFIRLAEELSASDW